MEKYWKAFCLISATSALGISLAVVGPAVHHAATHFDYIKPAHLILLFAGRGFGNFLGTLVSTYALAKSNQSFWTCLSLLILSASITVIPWCKELIILTAVLSVQGLVTAVAKSCTQNLLRFFHGIPLVGGSIQKFLHVAFAFGCFLTLACFIMFTNVSSYHPIYLPKRGFEYNHSDGSHHQSSSLRNIVKRSLVDANVSNNSIISYSLVATDSMPLNATDISPQSSNSSDDQWSTAVGISTLPSTTSSSSRTTPPETTGTSMTFGALDLLNLTSIGNDSEQFGNFSNSTTTARTSVSTTAVPKKPAVVDGNNKNHHNFGADGNIINKELKKELDINPLDVPLVATNKSASLSSTLATQLPGNATPAVNIQLNTPANFSTLPTTSKMLDPPNTSTLEYHATLATPAIPPTSNDTLVLSSSSSVNPSGTLISTTRGKPFSFSPSSRPSPEMLPSSLSPAPTPPSKVAAANSTTATIITLSTTATIITLSTTPANLIKSPSSTVSTNSNTIHHQDKSFIPPKLTAASNVDASTDGRVRSSPAASSTTTSRAEIEGGATDDGRHFVITKLSSLEMIVQHLSWDNDAETSGYILLSLLVLLVSGILAINSGICCRIKSCRNFLEVNYTCPDKDSAVTKNYLCIRASVVMFNCAYASAEILIGGLLAVYIYCLPDIAFFMGVAGTSLFWLCFLLGRLVFMSLSPLSKLFRLTLLANSLTVTCLIAFCSAPFAASSLPWYFFACMISLTSFFFSLISPSFSGYRENFPLLAYNPPVQEVITSLAEMIALPILSSLVFAGREPQLLAVLILLMVICLLSTLTFKFLANSVPRKIKTSRRKPSFNSEIWAENGEEAEVMASSSYDSSSTTKPLLPP